MSDRALGWIEDDESNDPDFDLLGLASSEPREANMLPRVPRLMQGAAPTCVAHELVWKRATRDAVDQWHLRRAADPSFDTPLDEFVASIVFASALHNHYHSRHLWGGLDQPDLGTYPSKSDEAARRFGMPEDRWWPYNLEHKDDQPSPETIMNAHRSRGPQGFYTIKDRGEALVDAMCAAIDAACTDQRPQEGERAGPVGFAMTLTGKAFYDVGPDDEVTLETMQGEVEGGHMLAARGYGPSPRGGRRIKVPNWWDDFGDEHGECWIHEEVIAAKARNVRVQTFREPGA